MDIVILIVIFIIVNNVYVTFDKIKLEMGDKCVNNQVLDAIGFQVDCDNPCLLHNEVYGWNTRKVRGIPVCEKEVVSEGLISTEVKPFCICKETILSRYIKPLFS